MNNYLGNKPLLLVFGSSTCPMTASSFQPLMNLFQEFGDQIGFIMLNVREAHPGEHFPQPQTFEQKHANASKMKERYQIPWAMAVDDIDGSFHRALDPKPNAAYIMNVEGNIVFRSLWAGDESALRTALEQVANGQEPSKKQSVAMFGPLSRGIGYFLEVLKLAGPSAIKDLILAAPPIALMSLLASIFKSLPVGKRGIAAIVTFMGILTAGAIVLFNWIL